MTVTRKHFNLIADAFRGTRPTNLNTDHGAQWLYDMHAVCDALATQNEKFDKQRFADYCKA
jgi:hypothetical protein